MESVRVVAIEGEPWFVARDVAATLGYSNTSKAISDHCKGITKRYLPTPGGEQEMTLIPERDVYRLVMRSKLPAAERFEEWVVGEVLPAIRKTGAYSAAPAAPALPDFSNPAEAARAWADQFEKRLALEGEVKEKAALIEQQAPAVEFARTVRDMADGIDFGSMARLLKWGRNRLIARLRDDAILMANNLPYQAYMDRGYFKVIEGTRARTDGTVSPTFTTRVTGRGQVFLQRRYAAAQ
jgi:anti-repressor protein